MSKCVSSRLTPFCQGLQPTVRGCSYSTGGAQKNWMTPNGGKKDLLHTQYVANKYFDTVEWKRHRASIILSKKKCLQPSSQRYALFLPPFAVIFFGSHFGWAPQNFMVSYSCATTTPPEWVPYVFPYPCCIARYRVSRYQV